MTIFKVAVFAAAVILLTAPAYATCVPWEGPPGVYARLNDPNFATSECWTFGGTAYHDSSNQVGALPSSTASISQSTSFSGESYSLYELVVDVDIITDGSPGSERLRLEVLNNVGQVIETIDIISVWDGPDDYYYVLNDYDGDDITIRARYDAGATPGGSVFTVDNFSIWVTP